MSVEKYVPQIRFKEFSREWDKMLLGSLCLIGDIDHRMPESKKTGIPYLMTGDFYGINGLDFNSAKLISMDDYEQLSKKIKPELGDILFARYASVGAVRYVETDTKFLISYSCAIMKTNNTTYGKYLFYFFQTERTQGQLELDINTGSQRNIGIDSLKSLLVALPKPAEQTRIGNTFQKLDSLINQHQQKHDKLSSIKKAMLGNMFPKKGETTPEIRFKGFREVWEEKALGDYTIFRRGSFPQPYGNKEWYGGEGSMPFVQVVDVSKELSLVEDTKQKISLKAQPLSVFVPKGSVVVTLQGTIGRVAVTQYDSFFDRTILIFQSFSKNTDSYFWAYTIQNKFDLEKKRAPGGTIKTITKDALSSFEVLIPSIEEQTKIGNYFQKLDALINQHQQQITKLNNVKQACLSKMFV
ncbi:restriction endonuclease subunit S [Psychromonas arctica]|uniref:restriction endonuclease subunit S n=1 Tax=Psychromonas arctica TaxID=168275 RepID=UPI0003FB7002|nr:restriction endonuclease subunit S [Psychromonas arctica]